MAKQRKMIRQEIGEILAEANSPLYSGQIMDRISSRPAARRINYSVNIIASVLRGAKGVQILYPRGTKGVGVARQYVMLDKKRYDRWINGDK